MTASLEKLTPTTLVTGCTGGIGREIVDLLAAQGHTLVLVSRDRAKLDALAREITDAHHVGTHVIVADLAQPGSAKAVFDATNERGIAIDILVNNAGIGMYGRVADIDVAAQTSMVLLNSVTPSELCAYYADGMRKRGRGKILNIASTVAYQPCPFMAAYGASKAFLLSYSEALAKELEGSGVTVTAISPGPTKTEFFARLDPSVDSIDHFAGGKRHEPRRVAEIAVAAMNAGRLSKVVGVKNFILSSSSRFAPRSLTARISKSLLSPRS